MEHYRNIERFAVQRRFSIGHCDLMKGIIMLLRDVEKFLKTHKMAATKFGRLAAHDPRFVLDLRMGRIPRKPTEERTLQWMEEFEAGCQAQARPRSFRLATNGMPIFEVKGLCYAA